MNNEYVTNYAIMQLLARRVKEYRLAARLSQKDLAEKSGVSLATICHFEQGKSPNMKIVFSIYSRSYLCRHSPFVK
jgi:transcriptional regulator with XRE-family HTH domain